MSDKDQNAGHWFSYLFDKDNPSDGLPVDSIRLGLVRQF